MSTESLGFERYFRRIQDTRRCPYHLLIDIIGIALCATIAGANDWAQIEEFGNTREGWLRRFFKLPYGIPSHDTFRRVFERIKPSAFRAAFLDWMRALAEVLGLKHIAVDGKTLRHSGSAAKGLKALHLVSAWAVENQLSLGQVAIDEKSNEITAIPRLLALLELNGALVTIDAMGCQKDIAKKIREGGGDYVLTVKDNQPNLLVDIQACLQEAFDHEDENPRLDHWQTEEKGHGRWERRSYTVVHDPVGIRDQEAWQDLCVVGMCTSERSVHGQMSVEVRYFIGSRRANARVYGQALRNHWSIENQLHWQLDVTFHEDANRERGRHAAENLAAIRKIALALLKQDTSKGSLRCKRLRAAYSEEFLEQVIKNCVNL
jgi:predicted transposase YbfD/YdcC